MARRQQEDDKEGSKKVSRRQQEGGKEAEKRWQRGGKKVARQGDGQEAARGRQ